MLLTAESRKEICYVISFSSTASGCTCRHQPTCSTCQKLEKVIEVSPPKKLKKQTKKNPKTNNQVRKKQTKKPQIRLKHKYFPALLPSALLGTTVGLQCQPGEQSHSQSRRQTQVKITWATVLVSLKLILACCKGPISPHGKTLSLKASSGI